MLERGGVPIQVISVCDPDGAVQPLRFRVEDERQECHTLYVRKILDVKRIESTGLENFLFLCRAEENGKEHLLELRYVVRTHRWILCRRLC